MNENERFIAEIKSAIDSTAPSAEQKEQIWRHLEAAMDGAADKGVEFADEAPAAGPDGPAQKQRRAAAAAEQPAAPPARRKMVAKAAAAKTPVARRVAAVAAAFILVVAAAGIAARFRDPGSSDAPAAAGYVYAAESRATGMTPQEILEFTADPATNGQTEVYAPAVYYLDSRRLIFGNGYGLIIYDRTAGKVEGLIDMQAICSSYYNCDSVKTHVTVSGSRLTVYNTKGDYLSYGMPDEADRDLTETAWGYYHIYDLDSLPGEAAFAECAESGSFETTDCDMYKEGSAFEADHYMDAWNNVAFLQTPEIDDAIGYNGGSYSENAYAYTDEKGSEQRCVLLCMSSGDDSYTLAEVNTETGEVKTESLATGVTDALREEVRGLCELPPYTYGGDDPVMKAICEDIAADKEGYMAAEEGTLLIPEPNIYGKAEEGDELLVFGDFFRDAYVKRGNTLVCVSGGSWPGCYHLKESESGDGSYVVSSIDMAQDGEGYADSIKEFTKGHPGIYSKFMASAGYDEASRKQYIKEYVESSGAAIEYYKDFGWDPIKLD